MKFNIFIVVKSLFSNLNFNQYYMNEIGEYLK